MSNFKEKTVLFVTNYNLKKINNLISSNNNFSIKYFNCNNPNHIKKLKKYLKKNILKDHILLSFSNSYIFKKDELIKFDISKRVNFHPGLPKYPGRDTSHFACFNNEKIFGGTIHSIEKKIDSGKIIEMKKFKVILKKPNHYIYTKLGHKAICYLLEKNFNSILNSKIKFKNIKWSKKLYTRKKFLRNFFSP